MAVVEGKSGVEKGVIGTDSDQFPVGMRVLAVDDDATCLMVLECLLRRCRYHVTATKQATIALKMLRENKERFDLVITDVHMPDMDGFKLLELVGLEMDLPVIMLSGEADHQDVMKAITHGACDYLVKPARMAELKNIWQHVIRRRKIESREKCNPHEKEDEERVKIASSEGGQALSKTEVPDCNRKLNRKRNQDDDDDDDDDECDSDDKTHANEKPSTQKKQRVIWSIELHGKFVATVNQLGIDKAVPKKILDLMNVEKLTRENVASHLQKYRIFLKKANALAIRQANALSTRQGRTPTYLPMGSLEGSRSFHSLTRSRQSPAFTYLQSPAFTSLQSNGSIGTVNKPAGFGLQALVSSGTFQQGNTHKGISHHFNDLRRFEGTVGSSHGNLLHRVPMSLEHQFLWKTNNCFPASLSNSGLAIGSSSKKLPNMTDNTLWIPEHQQQTHSGMLGTHSSSRQPSLSSDLFKIADTYHMADTLAHNNTPFSNSLYNTAPAISSIDSNLHEVFSSSLGVAPSSSKVAEGDVQNRASLHGCNRTITPSGIDESMKFSRNYVQNWEKEEQSLTHSPGIIFTSSTTLPNNVPGYVAENQPFNNGLPGGKMGSMTIGQSYDNLCITPDWRTDCQQNYSYTMETGKLHPSFSSNACTLDEVVNIPQKSEQDDVAFFDEDCVSDIDTPGTCM